LPPLCRPGGLAHGSFPSRLFSASSTGAVTTTPVIEYTVAISDHNLDTSTYTQTLGDWENVIRTNYRNNVPTSLLIHPSNDTFKKTAEIDILDRVSDLDSWVGDWKTFGQFWVAQGTTCSRWT
jgi:hypothetical protein